MALKSSYLEHNLFKNVSNGPAFWWQTQIQTLENDLNDTIRIKEWSYIDYQLISTLWHEFSNDFWQKFCHKKYGLLEPFLSEVCFSKLSEET